MNDRAMNKHDPLWERFRIDVDKLHTTEWRSECIKQNLGLDCDDVVAWCKRTIYKSSDEPVERIGENWYLYCGEGIVLTINSTSNMIITAKKTNHLKYLKFTGDKK
jgi:hypothetical protein